MTPEKDKKRVKILITVAIIIFVALIIIHLSSDNFIDVHATFIKTTY